MIGDRVWYDSNRNGIQDPDEPGIAGVKVILYGDDGVTKRAETLADGSGQYHFSGLPDGIYVVQFDATAGYVLTTTNAGTGALQDSFDSDPSGPDDKVSVTVTGGAANTTIDAGFYIPGMSPASLGDFVWYDTDKDGIQDGGEPGLGGVTVKLFLDANKDGSPDNPTTPLATTVSNANGFYKFGGLSAGDYVLQFIAPTGYSLSPPNAGGDDTKDSDAAIATGLTSTIPLTAGQQLTNWDAGLYLSTGSPGSIGDRVWYDSDGNGVQANTGEPGIPGVRVNLYDATGKILLQTALTDSSGLYHFNGLPAASYVVEFVKPNASYSFSTPTQGSDSAKDSDPNQISGRASVTLAAGDNNSDIDAGLRVEGQSPITVGDFVWKDADGDKAPDADEGLPSVQVVLYDLVGNELARQTTTTTTTTATNYTFTGVPAGGNYRVAIDTSTLGTLSQIADPDAILDNRTDLINLTASTDQKDFGYTQPLSSISINKTAADDTDNQQIRSGGTANFKITVTNTGNLTLTNVVVIDELTPACNFSIESLAPGATSTVKTCARNNVTSDYTNVAKVEAQPVDGSDTPIGDPVKDDDDSKVDVINPAITIEKTPETQSISSSGTASFTIKVKNTGDVTLTDVSVSDPLTGSCAKTKADIPALASMAPAAEVTYDCTRTGVTASFVNEATVTAKPPVGTPVTASDTAAVTVTTPGLSITKKPDVQTIHKGGSASFTITVTNTGSVDLTDVAVVDENSPGCAKTIGTLGITDDTKTQTYTCTHSPVNAPFDNTATVNAKAGAEPLSANDVAKVNVIEPKLEIEKLTNDYDGLSLRVGTLVTWEYIVRNTGNVDLTDITVSDDKGVVVTCPRTTLAAGVSMTCLGFGPAELGSYTNTGTVTGKSTSTDPSKNTVTASDDSSYIGVNPGSIGNRVWLDEDSDGVQDAGEAGIPNVTVTLYRPGVGPDGIPGNADDNDEVRTTLTDTDGGYLFTELPAGNYEAVVTPIGGLNPTWDEDSGPISDPGTETVNETVINLKAGAHHITADFGYNWVLPVDSSDPEADTLGALGDRVWIDANRDGVQDPGEAGIGGVTLTLTEPGADGILGTADDTTETTMTDVAGNYIFDDLPRGAYVVTVDTTTLPDGVYWTQTGDPDGTASTDNRTTTPILLAPGDVFVNADFGYWPSQSSAIGDFIWFDANADGIQDLDESGVSGITVALLNEDGKHIATTRTDINGGYLFPGLLAGEYTVVIMDTDGLLYTALPSTDPDLPTNPDLPREVNNGMKPDPDFDGQSTVTVNGSDDNLTRDFGYMPWGMHDFYDHTGLIGVAGLIGDTVFLDGNDNGQPDSGEGLQGVVVKLYQAPKLGDPDPVNPVAWTTTNAEGVYAFAHVNVYGDWLVKVDTTSLPFAGAGLANTVDPDDGDDSKSLVSNLAATGNLNLDQDFGYRASNPATLGGTIWQDLDANGVLDPSKPYLQLVNITVELRDEKGNKVATTQTDSQGNYRFTGLPAGTYSVHVTDTRNLLEGWWHSLGNPDQDVDNQSKADPFTVEVDPGETNTNVDFGYYYLGAALGNRVWLDQNFNGLQDAGEIGRGGVTVQLVVTYPGGGNTTLKTVTGSDGGYRFGNLLLDESFIGGEGADQPAHVISVVIPAGSTSSPVEVGANRLIDSSNPAGASATVLKGQVNTTLASDPNTEPDNASYDFGFAGTYSAVDLTKTAFLTKEAGASCATGKSPLVYVNKEQAPVDVTWCFKVTNLGNQPLENPVIVDQPLGKTLANMTLLPGSGTLPLQPGKSIVWYYDDKGRTTSMENEASITMTPVGGGDPVSATDDEAIFAYVYDPPYGVKTGRVNGANVIRWNMVWINNSPIDAPGVVINDPIKAGMTYRPGTLTCDARGSTKLVGTCDDTNYNGTQKLIQVTADFGPDLGATDEASANNEFVISFEVTVENPSGGQSFENQAEATWDPDGPGGVDPWTDVTDDNAPGGTDPTPIVFPVPIPTMSEWAMILLTLMLMGMVWRSRSRFGVNR